MRLDTHGSDERDITKKRQFEQESMYVELFQNMLCTVLESESHLFTASEHACLLYFFELHRDARYLFVRLLQRKKDQWYRLDKLEYAEDVDDLEAAAQALCKPFAACSSSELFRYAIMDDEMKGGMRARLELLTVEELRLLAKQLGKKRTGTRVEIVSALLTKPTNSVLIFDQNKLTTSTSASYERLESCVSTIMHGGWISLDSTVYALMTRVALVYHRGKPVLGPMLTSAVLARTRKCVFPKYEYSRQSHIFVDRESLLRYEKAEQCAELMDELIEKMRAQPDAAREGVTLLDTYEHVWHEAVQHVRSLYPDDIPRERYHLIRFHYGWALTRVLYKACECLARLRMFEREMQVWTWLLNQRYFWRARRGAWYDRLCLLMARHESKAKALLLCHEALADADTHIVYTFTLQRRISRLESQLRIPKNERCTFEGHIEPRNVTFHGVRVDGRIVQSKSMLRQTVLCGDASTSSAVPAPAPPLPLKTGQRTQWQSASGTHCTVEQYCLEQYALQGFRGYHCEGSLLLFMFVLLMWDVLFLPVPGAFETPYQRAPMDLGTDVFLEARREAIEAQLHRIHETGGQDIIQQVDKRERPRRTYALGCRWDHFALDDVLEVAECLGGRVLAKLCRVLCENGANTAGFPDLTLWRWNDRQVRIVEVKSPRDRLNEMQRVWIDVLLQAGVHVDLAKVHIITDGVAQSS